MRIKPSQKSFLSIESVAMTDIVLNMFIFFFISFSMLYTFNPHKESEIEVKLPKGMVKEESKENAMLVVTITSGNEIYIGETRILPEMLNKELSSRYHSAEQSGVLIKSDKSASVDYLVKVLDAAKQTGIEKLGVALQQE